MGKTQSETREAHCRQVAALPWRVDRGKVSILIVTSRTNAKWMLPKGWPMSGRTDAEAARQEALEEAGIEGVISERPVASYRFIKLFDDGSIKPSQAVVFSLQVTVEHRKWDERRQRRRRWVTPRKASEMVFEPDLARLLANVAAGRIVLG